MANPWFKFYGGEYLSDPKILSLDANERSCWVTILSLASQTKDGVVRFISEERILELSGVKRRDHKKYTGVLNKFNDLLMISKSNADVTVLNWSKRQYSESYERVMHFREKQKSNAYLTTDKKREEKKRTEEIQFESFWKEYPQKVAKKKAFQSWIRIGPDEEVVKKIMSGLTLYKKSPQWTKDGGKFIPHPTTWLNQERWKDEVVDMPMRKVPEKRFCNGKGCGKDLSRGFIESNGSLYCNFDCLYAK